MMSQLMKRCRVQVDKLAFALIMFAFAFFAAASYGECSKKVGPNDPVSQAFSSRLQTPTGLVLDVQRTDQNNAVIKLVSISDAFIATLPAEKQTTLKNAKKALDMHLNLNMNVALCSTNQGLSFQFAGTTVNVTKSSNGNLRLAGPLFGNDGLEFSRATN